jgi:hypothetical protein
LGVIVGGESPRDVLCGGKEALIAYERPAKLGSPSSTFLMQK